MEPGAPLRPLVRPPNYRDVGEALGLWLDPSPLAPGVLLRGGKIGVLTTHDDLGAPRTIVNLRRGSDPPVAGARVLHVPADDTVENYDTHEKRVRTWLHAAMGALAAAEPPVYVHCTAGRDRTGVVIAAALVVLGVDEEAIVGDFGLSDGADVRAIRRAIHGLGKGAPHLAAFAPALAKALRIGA